jgi:hypothetical protein
MVTELDHRIGVENPELVVSTLLQHALHAARHAFAAAYPEIGTSGNLGELEDDRHLALLIAHQILELDDLLARYREVTEALWRAHDDRPLPF